MKKIHIVLIVLIIVAISAIIGTVSDSSTYVGFAEAEANPGKEFHVVGMLNKEKGMDYNPQLDANKFSFYLRDSLGVEKKVIYNGTKPQDFERSERIVIVGKSAGSEFNATQILMKCPSKYNNGQVEVMQEKTAES